MNLGRQQLVESLAVALLVTPVCAQSLERIEPGIADVGPLSISMRDLNLDLRQPSNFDNVYRVPGNDDLLMRAEGGLHAVFPRSRYAPVQIARTQFDPPRVGMSPTIPDSTVFYIGRPAITDPVMDPRGRAATADPPPPPPSRLPDLRVDTRVYARSELVTRFDGRITTRDLAPVDAPPPVPDLGRRRTRLSRPSKPTIVTDPDLRAARLRTLIRQATDAALH